MSKLGHDHFHFSGISLGSLKFKQPVRESLVDAQAGRTLSSDDVLGDDDPLQGNQQFFFAEC